MVSKNITCSAVTLNTKDCLLFSFEDILQISVKKRFIKVIQFIICEDLQINIGNKNSPTLLVKVIMKVVKLFKSKIKFISTIYTIYIYTICTSRRMRIKKLLYSVYNIYKKKFGPPYCGIGIHSSTLEMLCSIDCCVYEFYS